MPSQLIITAQKGCCYEIKDKQLLKQLGSQLTLNSLYAFNVHEKDGVCFRVVRNDKQSNLY